MKLILTNGLKQSRGIYVYKKMSFMHVVKPGICKSTEMHESTVKSINQVKNSLFSMEEGKLTIRKISQYAEWPKIIPPIHYFEIRTVCSILQGMLYVPKYDSLIYQLLFIKLWSDMCPRNSDLMRCCLVVKLTEEESSSLITGDIGRNT